jgi:hypothetical protein
MARLKGSECVCVRGKGAGCRHPFSPQPTELLMFHVELNRFTLIDEMYGVWE